MNATEEWVESTEHPGYRVKVIKHGCGTIQILRPQLDAKEQAKREAHAKTVAERTLSSYYRRKETEGK